MSITDRRRRGSALLAVLWLSAALSAIAIALADTVRGEAERSATAVDDLRSHNLAEGGLRRALLYMWWRRGHPDVPRYQSLGPYYTFDFPEGQTVVEIIPETSKLNINSADPNDLFKLLMNLGVPDSRAQQITAAIVDWRSPPSPMPTPFDVFYQTLRPPYAAAHAAFQDVEELLSVEGVTPDLFYGAWQPAPADEAHRLLRREGLEDCLSVFGSTGLFDVNTAPPPVLATAGIPPAGIAALVQQRRIQPFLTEEDLAPFAGVAGPAFGRLRIGGVTMFTLKSTARLRLVNGQLSDLRRTVGALVKFTPTGFADPYHVLRWYDSMEATP